MCSSWGGGWINEKRRCMFLLSSTLVSFVYSSKWVYLKPRHRNQTATTVKCSQLQWLPPSSPASRGKYRAGRGGDPRFAMSLSWISPAATLTRSLRSKCQRRGEESRVSRSAGWGGVMLSECNVFKNACVHRTAQPHRLHILIRADICALFCLDPEQIVLVNIIGGNLLSMDMCTMHQL